MLGPGERPIHGGQIGHRLADLHHAVGSQFEFPLEIELRQRQMRLGDHAHARDFDLIRRDRRFAMYSHARRVLSFRRRTENIQAQIMAQNPGKQLAFGIVAIFGMASARCASTARSRATAASTADSRRISFR